MMPKRVSVHLAIWATLLAICSPKRFLQFAERVTKPLGIASGSNDSVIVVAHGFRDALAIVVAAVLLGTFAGLSLSYWFGAPTLMGVSALQIIGAAVLLMATIYLRGPAIQTWDRETLIERVDRWIYCAGYVLGTAAVVTSLVWY